MARRKEKLLTENEVKTVHLYFKRILNDPEKCKISLVDPDNQHKAKKRLPEPKSYKRPDVLTKSMQIWVDQHVSPEGVKWMWAALRQRAYQKSKKPVMVAMAPDIHSDLKQLAKDHQLTLSEMTKKLISHYST